MALTLLVMNTIRYALASSGEVARLQDVGGRERQEHVLESGTAFLSVNESIEIRRIQIWTNRYLERWQSG